jgi:hypothetical protein
VQSENGCTRAIDKLARRVYQDGVQGRRDQQVIELLSASHHRLESHRRLAESKTLGKSSTRARFEGLQRIGERFGSES